jgi:DNA processing protein
VSACEQCLRRTWLIAGLGACLDYLAPDRERLWATLALSDDELIEALGGRRRGELRERYTAYAAAAPSAVDHAHGPVELCRHASRYPQALASAAAPQMLHLAGSIEHFARLSSAPLVAILGCAKASDYGLETARGLARALTASGVTVASTLGPGVPLAAQRGALEGGGGLAVCGTGLGVAARGCHRALIARLAARGCAVSEVPCDSSGRRWGAAASERIVVELAQVVVVVEARDLTYELAGARLARALGRELAAIPGRVCSPLSAGAHALLREGARLARDAEDVLELLSASPITDLPRGTSNGVHPRLTPTLEKVLERVGAGSDTPDKLAEENMEAGELLLALSELELMGLLTRGENGRYLPSKHEGWTSPVIPN